MLRRSLSLFVTVSMLAAVMGIFLDVLPSRLGIIAGIALAVPYSIIIMYHLKNVQGSVVSWANTIKKKLALIFMPFLAAFLGFSIGAWTLPWTWGLLFGKKETITRVVHSIRSAGRDQCAGVVVSKNIFVEPPMSLCFGDHRNADLAVGSEIRITGRVSPLGIQIESWRAARTPYPWPLAWQRWQFSGSAPLRFRYNGW